MPIVQNPAYQNPLSPLSAALGNLAKAMLSGPTAEEMDLRAAQAEQARAGASKATAEAELATRKLGAAKGIADTVAGMYGPLKEAPRPTPETVGPMPQMSRDQQIATMMPQLFENAASLGEIDKIGGISLAATANAPGVTDPTVVRSLVGSGKTLGKDEAVSLPGQETIRQGNFDAALKQATTVENIQQAGLDRRHNTAAARYVVSQNPDGTYSYQPVSAGLPAPTPGMSHSPRNYIGANGQRGVTLDGVRDAATNQPIGPGAQIFGSQVQAQNISGLTPTQAGQTAQSIAGMDKFKSYLGIARTLGSDPRNFGTAGFLRSTVQDGIAQGSALAQTIGGKLQEIQAEVAQTAPGVGLEAFDPRLPQLEAMNNILAYEAARVMAGQEGRSVSNQDIKNWRGVIGATGFLANKDEYLAKLDLLEQLLGVNRGSAVNLLGGGALPGATPAPGAPTAPRIRIDLNGNPIQ
jgi:hypothetical protein